MRLAKDKALLSKSRRSFREDHIPYGTWDPISQTLHSLGILNASVKHWLEAGILTLPRLSKGFCQCPLSRNHTSLISSHHHHSDGH